MLIQMSFALQVVAAVLQSAEQAVRDEAKQELVTVLHSAKAVDAWAKEVLGAGAESAAKKMTVKS